MTELLFIEAQETFQFQNKEMKENKGGKPGYSTGQTLNL